MPALPPISNFTGSTVTEGQFKTALNDLRAYLAGLLGTDGNAATALATLGSLGSGYVSKTATYTVVSSDRGRMIDSSGTFTLNLTAAATLGAGFTIAVRNSGTGDVTLDPSGAELIDGVATVTLPPGEAYDLYCTGTAWRSSGRVLTTSFATDEYVKQSFSLFQTFSSLASGASRSIGSPSYMIWASYSSTQWSRGTYYTNMFYMAAQGKSSVQVNMGNCRHTIWNYSTTKSMQINLTAVINFAADDTYGFQIRQNGSIVGTYGTYSARGVQTYNFGTFTVPPNSTVTFDLYGSILSGSSGDSIYVNSFTATYIQFV